MRLVLSPRLGGVVDVFGQDGVMVIAAPIPYPYRDGGRKTAGHGAHKIADPRSRSQLVRGYTGHEDLIQWQEEKRHAQSLQEPRRGELHEAGTLIPPRGP